MLDLARLESGHLAIHPAPTDLAAIIGDAAEAVAAQTAAKNLTVTVNAPATLDLYADGGRLQQVADNLLSNAVKYTPAGGAITITAALDNPHGEQVWITWTVADTGIPAADRPHLFRRFYRASTALDRRIPGTGLGLVITRAIIERHGGTISLDHHDGPGTTFRIRIPPSPRPSPLERHHLHRRPSPVHGHQLNRRQALLTSGLAHVLKRCCIPKASST